MVWSFGVLRYCSSTFHHCFSKVPSPRGSAAFGQLSTAPSSQQSETITFSKSTGISAGVCTGLEIVGIQWNTENTASGTQFSTILSVFSSFTWSYSWCKCGPPTGVLHQVKIVKLFIQLHIATLCMFWDYFKWQPLWKVCHMLERQCRFGLTIASNPSCYQVQGESWLIWL